MWMAPEVRRGVEYTEKVDQFAFGVVLFEVLTGLAPHIASGMELPQSVAAV